MVDADYLVYEASAFGRPLKASLAWLCPNALGCVPDQVKDVDKVTVLQSYLNEIAAYGTWTYADENPASPRRATIRFVNCKAVYVLPSAHQPVVAIMNNQHLSIRADHIIRRGSVSSLDIPEGGSARAHYLPAAQR